MPGGRLSRVSSPIVPVDDADFARLIHDHVLDLFTWLDDYEIRFFEFALGLTSDEIEDEAPTVREWTRPEDRIS